MRAEGFAEMAQMRCRIRHFQDLNMDIQIWISENGYAEISAIDMAYRDLRLQGFCIESEGVTIPAGFELGFVGKAAHE
jgi:hypothetical protein